jgi:hypothetical protein
VRPARVVLALALLFAGGARGSGFVSYSDKNGVKIEWRDVEGARVKEIRAVGTVRQPLERLVAVLRDVEHFPDFMPPTEKVELVGGSGDARRLHITINPSWISRRDYCIEVTWTHFPDGSVGSRWSQFDEGCPPPTKGVVRHLRTDGTWRLRALDGQRTLVEYQAITDPGGSVPAWVVSRGTARAMRGMFETLARRAAEPQYAPADGR